MYPTGHSPHDQEPSGKLVHLVPAKHGLERQPSVHDRIELCYFCLTRILSLILNNEAFHVSPTGHSWALHKRLPLESPRHSFPPYLGAGLLHKRCLRCSPPPHVTEQESHGDQGPQPPFTETQKEMQCQLGFQDISCKHSNSYMVNTHLGTGPSGMAQSGDHLPRSLCHPSEALGSCTAGCE